MNLHVYNSLLLLVLCLVCGWGLPVRHDTFQIRRPIKYFFHLLQLKSDYNPLLYFSRSKSNSCSSKAGPFCRITNHPPLQTHHLKQLDASMSNIILQMQNIRAHSASVVESIERDSAPVFLIRNNLQMVTDEYLRKKIGDVMHKQDMLSAVNFVKVQSQSD